MKATGNPSPGELGFEDLKSILLEGGIDALRSNNVAALANERLFTHAFNPVGYRFGHLDTTSTNSKKRWFVHDSFPREIQQDGEAILEEAELGYFPAVDTINDVTIRQVPKDTIPLITHRPSHETAITIADKFLVPTLKQLYERKGVVPARLTLANLVHVENLERTNTGDDVIETGVRFVPPYSFEPVQDNTFAPIAAKNSEDYGSEVLARVYNVLSRPY